MQGQGFKAGTHRPVRAGQEAGAHPPCLCAEAQIKAGRLNLVTIQRMGGADSAGVAQIIDLARA